MNPIAARVLGHFPLSVGTSHAIEKLFGLETDERGDTRPTGKDASKPYQSLWINVETLFRNLTSAMERNQYLVQAETELAYALFEELEQLRYIITSHSSGRMQAVFYWGTYPKLASTYPNASLRTPNTDLQKQYHACLNTTLTHLVQLTEHSAQPLLVSREHLQGEPVSTTLILTHSPIDLLSGRYFKRLDLLESYTGFIKTRALWSSKLHNGKNLAFIPFNATTLQIFGDSEHFHPQSLKLRAAVIQVAQANHWSAVTTRDKMKFTFERLADPALRLQALSLVS